MPKVTDTQSLRYGVVGDPVSYTMIRDLADDIATQLDLADAARITAMQRPSVLVGRTTALSLPASMTPVPWTTTFGSPDPHGMTAVGGGTPSRVTVTASAGAGTYFVTAEMQNLYTGWTRADIAIYRNGSYYAQRTWRAPQDLNPLQFSSLVNLPNVGDYVEMYVYHEGGGTTSGNSFSMYVTKNSST